MKEVSLTTEQYKSIKNMISALCLRDKRSFETLMYAKASDDELLIKVIMFDARTHHKTFVDISFK